MQQKTYVDLLQESALHIAQACQQIRYHGLEGRRPDTATYKQVLTGELEDFLAVIACLETKGVINLTSSQQNIKTKFQQLFK